MLANAHRNYYFIQGGFLNSISIDFTSGIWQNKTPQFL